MNIVQIKNRLKEKNMTYEDLSTITNLSISTIKKILSGAAKFPRVDTIEIIEKALGIKEPTQTTVIKNSLSNKEERLLDAFNSLIPPMQDYIIEMVEKLLTQPQNIIKKA